MIPLTFEERLAELEAQRYPNGDPGATDRTESDSYRGCPEHEEEGDCGPCLDESTFQEVEDGV